MVGHTGVFEAAVEAVEAVDKCIGRVVESIREKGGTVLITADHGNAEQMVDYTSGEPHTAHTSNPVPFILVGDRHYRLHPGKLADVAPTMLELLNIEKPEEMTGESLMESDL
jgi:2,3-bisphosphoglycerate-independent phosphoglycerate mutase